MALGNRVYVRTGTVGQGTLTLGAVLGPQYCTLAEAGVADGSTIRSFIIEEGSDFEISTGVYTLSGVTLTRASVRLSKIAGAIGTTKMTLGGNATVRLIAANEDIAKLTDDNTFAGIQTISNATDITIPTPYVASGGLNLIGGQTIGKKLQVLGGFVFIGDGTNSSNNGITAGQCGFNINGGTTGAAAGCVYDKDSGGAQAGTMGTWGAVTNGLVSGVFDLTPTWKSNKSSGDLFRFVKHLTNSTVDYALILGTDLSATFGGAVAAVGSVTLSAGSFKANSQSNVRPAIDTSGQAGYSIGIGASQVITDAGGVRALLITEVTVSGQQGLYLAGAGNVPIFVGGDTIFAAPTATPAAGKCSVYYDGTTYTLYTNFPQTRSFRVAAVRF